MVEFTLSSFAVNFETEICGFQSIDFYVERPILYSFMVSYQPRDYMSNIRKHIFGMKHHDNADIINTGIYLDNIVFQQTKLFR